MFLSNTDVDTDDRNIILSTHPRVSESSSRLIDSTYPRESMSLEGRRTKPKEERTSLGEDGTKCSRVFIQTPSRRRDANGGGERKSLARGHRSRSVTSWQTRVSSCTRSFQSTKPNLLDGLFLNVAECAPPFSDAITLTDISTGVECFDSSLILYCDQPSCNARFVR